MRRIEEVEQAAREREHRESSNPAGSLLEGAGEKILKCQAEKKAQAEQQR